MLIEINKKSVHAIWKWIFLIGCLAICFGTISGAHASILGITSTETDKAKIDAVFPKLIANTDQCLTDCSATFTYCLDGDNTLKMDFSKTKGNADISYGYYTTQTVASDVQGKCLKETEIDCDAQQKDCNTICDDNKNNTDTNCTDLCKADYDSCVKDKPTTCIEYDKEVVYNDVTTWNKGLPEGKKGCYNITINGHKNPNENVDWMPTITVNGFLWDTEYTQEKWAWWNNSWAKCRNITISNSSALGDLDYTDYDMNFNLTNLTFSSINEIRIVNNSCDNGGTEIPRDIITNTSNSTDVLFYFNKTAGVNTTYSVYYNNTGAPAPGYASIFNLANNTEINVSGSYTYKKNGGANYIDAGVMYNSSGKLLGSTLGGNTEQLNFYNAGTSTQIFKNSVWNRTLIANGSTFYMVRLSYTTVYNLTFTFYKRYIDINMTKIVPSETMTKINLSCSGTVKATINSSNNYTSYTSGDQEPAMSENWSAGYCNSTGASEYIFGLLGKNLNWTTTNANRIYIGNDYHPLIEIGADYPTERTRLQIGSVIRYQLESGNTSLTGDAQYYVPVQQDYYRFIYPPTMTLGAEESSVAPNTPVLNAPTNGSTGNIQNTLLQATCTDNDTTNLNYIFYNATSNTAFCTNNTIANNTLVNCTLNNLPANTNIKWYVNCTDGILTTMSGTNNFTTDTIPTITIVSPTNTTYTSLSFWLNGTSSKTSNWTYSLDNAANVSTTNASTTSNTQITTTSGAHNIIAYLTSSTGYSNASSTIYFTTDIQPSITLNAPANGSTGNNANTILQATCISYFGSQSITFYNATNNAIFCANTSTTNNTAINCPLSNLVENTNIKWYVNCTDGILTTMSGTNNFTTDTIPTITIASPTNTTYNSQYISLTTTSNKTVSWSYSLDNGANASYSTSTCYQESANVSNQSGIDGSCGQSYTGYYSYTGSGMDDPTLWFDGDWNTATSMTTDGFFEGYATYIKPAGITNATIRLKGGDDIVTDVVIPSTGGAGGGCFGYNSTSISIKMSLWELSGSPGIHSWTVLCYGNYTYNSHGIPINATGWISLTGGTNSHFYEEAMLWGAPYIIASEGSHNITVYGTSTAGYSNSSIQYFTVDTTPPNYSSLTNPANPQLTSSGLISAYWQDANLSGYMFSHSLDNITWTNDTSVAFTGTANWSNITVTMPNYPTTYYYIIYANDSVNNIADTGIQSFAVLCNASTFLTAQSITSQSYLSCNIAINASLTNFTSNTFTHSNLYINENKTKFDSNIFADSDTFELNNSLNTTWTGNSIDSLTYIGSNYITQDKSFSQQANLLLNNPTLFWANFTDNVLTFNYVEFSFDYNYTDIVIPGVNYSSSGSWTNLVNFNDSNWGTYAVDSSGNAIVNFSYAVPTNANINESYLVYKDITGLKNLTIPSECWGSSIKFEAVSSSAPNNTLYCMNTTSGAWILLYNSTTAAAHNRIYETEMVFQIISPAVWHNMTYYGNGIFYINYTTPLVQQDAPSSISYRWIDAVYNRNYSFGTILRSITVGTNSSLGNQILCTNYHDEANETAIANMQSQAIFNVFDNAGQQFNFYINDTGDSCYYTTTSANNLTYNVQINYQKPQNATDYATRSFIHYGYDTAGFANITLYDMPPQYYLTARTLDVSTAPMENLLIVAKRNYPSHNDYESVAMCSTSNNGECNLFLYFNTVFYQIDVYNGNQLLGQINPQTFGNQYANGIKDYDIFITNSTALSAVDNTKVSYNIYYNPSTNLLIATISGSGVNVTPYNFLVYQKLGFNNYLVYNQSSSTPVTTFIYNVTNLTGGYYATLSGQGILIGSTFVNLTPIQATENGIAIIMMIAAMGIVFALALVSPILGLIIGVLVIITFTTMGYLEIQNSMIGIGGLIMALAFFMWRYLK